MFLRTLPDAAQNALAVLGKSKILDFAYMAGGTALALHLGHRSSVDFDFFSSQEFDEEEIKRKLELVGEYRIDEQRPRTMLGYFDGVKFSLFWYRYPLIKETVECLGVKLASIEDIAAMKLAATLGRATKKDYIDVFFLLKRFGLEGMMKSYEQKFKNLESNKLALIKGMQYFE